MKKTAYNFWAFLFLLGFISCTANDSKPIDNTKITNISKTDTSLNGLYTGLEELCWTDSTGKKDCYLDSDPKWKWYHLGHLKIKGDSVFLDQSPVSIYKKDTTYSASDGAFYYYSGTLSKSDTTVVFNLKELFCDYCAVPVEIKPDGTWGKITGTKQLKGRLTDKGIMIDGYLYARATENRDLISEYPGAYLKAK